jgi:histidine ammonia-lyase
VTPLQVGDADLSIAEVVEFGRSSRRVSLAAGMDERIAASRKVVDQHLQSTNPVYGLTTSLGSKVGEALTESDAEWTEEKILLNRMVAVGETVPMAVCRTAMLLRLRGLCHGAAGVSPSVVDTLQALINGGVVVQIPSIGSMGASDLGPGATLGGALLGHGTAWLDGESMPMAEAMNRVGVAPCVLARKDALGLFNTSAVTLARAAHLVSDLRAMLASGFVSAVACADAFGVNPQVFRDAVQRLKPLPYSVEAAALIRGLLNDSWVMVDGAVKSPQQAISFRTLAPAMATVVGAIDRVSRAVEFEMNSIGDNPAVLLESGDMSSTSHFHTIEVALQVDAAAIALAQWANASAQRIQRLINHRDPDLPQLLSTHGGVATGLNPLQKTVAVLHAAIRMKTNPVSVDALAVSDQVEDVASHLPLAVEKLEEQLRQLRVLTAIEAFTAHHAHGLRKGASRGRAAQLLDQWISTVRPPFREDRPVGAEVEAVQEILVENEVAALGAVAKCWPGCPLA